MKTRHESLLDRFILHQLSVWFTDCFTVGQAWVGEDHDSPKDWPAYRSNQFLVGYPLGAELYDYEEPLSAQLYLVNSLALDQVVPLMPIQVGLDFINSIGQLTERFEHLIPKYRLDITDKGVLSFRILFQANRRIEMRIRCRSVNGTKGV